MEEAVYLDRVHKIKDFTPGRKKFGNGKNSNSNDNGNGNSGWVVTVLRGTPEAALKRTLYPTERIGSSCNQPQKSIDYLRCLGTPAPIAYSIKAETKLQVAMPVYH